MRREAVYLAFSLILSACAKPFDFFGFDRNHRPPASNDNEYYECLGVSRTASESEIKQAYRQKAKILHPDRGGNPEQFKLLAQAYEILSDSEKRSKYDRYGKEGVLGSGQGQQAYSSNADLAQEIFRQFSQFSMPVVVQLQVSLEDLYKGKEVSLGIQNQGVVKINIEVGMRDGDEILCKGSIMNDKYTGNSRDLIIRIKQIPNNIFIRKNNDLMLTLDITLREALMGFERIITHLDGKKIYLCTKEGDITSSDDILMIENMGMPKRNNNNNNDNNNNNRGNLFIKIKIQFPSKMWLLHKEKEILNNLLKIPSKLSYNNIPESVVDSSRREKIKKDSNYIEMTKSSIELFGISDSSDSDEFDDDDPFARFFR
jgi:DnaJ-class molecular chaperone